MKRHPHEGQQGMVNRVETMNKPHPTASNSRRARVRSKCKSVYAGDKLFKTPKFSRRTADAAYW